ncbi:MAG: DUF1501 domain-containing protein [Planctomycetaceae bacterium]|nr:DUF1501 domain-containing protein [Planctomycetaceae bacterium]
MNNQTHQQARRWFLRDCGIGLGAIALNGLLQQHSAAADAMAPKQSHHAPKAKSVIQLFMGGGPSHLELFDYKPMLARYDGTLPPAELVKNYRAAFIDPNSTLLGPKFKFAKYGQCGAELSELLPHMAEVVDDIAIVKSMVTDAFNHAPAQIFMSTGSQQFGKPSLGAWTLYGLGCESRDLPAFVVFNSGKKGPSGGNANWGSGFLPTMYQGVTFRSTGDPVLYLSSPTGIDQQTERESLDAINRLNQLKLDVIGDPEIKTRVNAFEMAYRMQSSAPELMDLSSETQATLDMYGAKPGEPSFALNCLLARRLIERGVRFVELFHESWDQHGGLVRDLKANCQATDQASAALIKDLKQRGLLDETLVIWGGEFGRTPMVQGSTDGRDHHPNAFTMWLAGGGIRGGVTYGESDDFGFNVTDQRVHVHDLHHTILHLLGFDAERFTFPFQGLNQRLIGVEPSHIVQEILA